MALEMLLLVFCDGFGQVELAPVGDGADGAAGGEDGSGGGCCYSGGMLACYAFIVVAHSRI